MSQTRRLAAILAADVAGYSRLMGADEEGTHERLMRHLRELVNPKIGEHSGRVVKNTGDGFLAEFASVVEAVRCAVEVQRGMAERNAEAPPKERIEFRIGINLGDVIVEEHDIFGDGVNVAARLEALAEPGGICVSRVVRDQVRDKLEFAFEDRGEQSVKNIARPVRVYAWHAAALTDASVPLAPAAPRISQFVAPRLSIVVLPFANLSNDPEQQYFADGITEDVTTDLSRLAGMFVISRTTAFTYRNKPVNTRQIGRELGVRYVLEGSVRRSGNQVRVSAQLVDAETDAHLWAERFDSATLDYSFALQNEITARIANTLSSELIRVEAARLTTDPDVLDYILRGRAAWANGPTREKYAEAEHFFERALALDPGCIEAQARLANTLAVRVLDGMSNSVAVDLARAEGLVDQTLATSPRRPLVHFVKGQLLRAQHRHKEALPEYETVIALDRNFEGALFNVGRCRIMTGSLDEAIPVMEQSICLSPRHPFIGNYYGSIGTVHLLQSRTDEAITWFEKARGANPQWSGVHASLASVYALRGDTKRAAAELAEARRLNVDDRYSSLTRLKSAQYWGVPKIRALFETTFFAGLRKAGMPEE
jgi:adenylate cyclase